jgi:hypothetical protein
MIQLLENEYVKLCGFPYSSLWISCKYNNFNISKIILHKMILPKTINEIIKITKSHPNINEEQLEIYKNKLINIFKEL